MCHNLESLPLNVYYWSGCGLFTTTFGFPEELLITVFSIASDSPITLPFDSFYAEPWLLMVRLVCRDWKRVLDGWSPYWANLLGIAPNEKVWDYLLQKAKSSPIAISINYSVSFRLQAAAVSRAARIFVAGNVLLDSWAATISAIPDLTELQTLHLMRSEGTNSGRNAMKILGSRLQNLSLGRPATVVAPSLRALRLTRLRSDMLSCLAGILDSSLRLREICIHDDTCSQSNLWATVFEMIQESAIESLSV